MGVFVDTNGLFLVSQGVGYGFLIGFAVIFCITIIVSVKIQQAYLQEDSGNSEMFMVANRTVGSGLTASAVFSSWMWISETVFACVVCYQFGIAAPMWYGVGLAFQITVMAVIGVLAKIRAPFAHTSLELIKLRYGRAGHGIYIGLCLALNIISCASMILTGSQLVYGMTGMNIAAATVLLPFGVAMYTAVGGLKATFLTDYFHTLIALVLMIYFTIATLTNENIGGIHGLYDKIVANAHRVHIPGNFEGSLITFKSKPAILWGLILRMCNLSLVIMDTAFWQKSFATNVHATVPGYELAALAIFAVPFALGTIIGLAARVIETLPIFPTYPHPLTISEISSGLVMPYTLQALLGNNSIYAFLILVFMALTSTISSSMIAVSSILSFDIYKTYISPRATDKMVVRASHIGVVFHAFLISGVSLALNYGGANLNWLAYFLPILTSSGIIPLILSLIWSRQSKLAAIVSPLLGLASGFTVWLATTHALFGKVNLTTTNAQEPCLYGALTSLFSPALYSVVISLWRPANFDWREYLRIQPLGDLASSVVVRTENGEEPNEDTSVDSAGDAKDQGSNTPVAIESENASLDAIEHPFDAQTLRELYRWYKIAWAAMIVGVLVTWFIWPMPLYRDWIFSKPFFSGWITVSLIWQFFAFGAVVVYPLWDGRHQIIRATVGIKKDFSAWRKNK